MRLDLGRRVTVTSHHGRTFCSGGRMIRALLPLALLPLVTLAADAPRALPPMKHINNADVAVEELAHSYFFHADASAEELGELITMEGVNKLKPELAEHRREMTDVNKLVTKARQLCTDLRRAR